jgi:hypothetical protein
MSFTDTIKAKIGPECYARLESEAQKEVARAMQMPLKDKFYEDQYYSPRLLLREFQADSERFQKAGLWILPVEIVWVLFRCKVLAATQSEREFQQRRAGGGFFENRATLPQWADKGRPLDAIEDQYMSGLEADIQERTLLSPINSLNPHQQDVDRQQEFFEDLFRTLDVPFVSFLETKLIEKHKQYERGLPAYELDAAMRFFSAPSLGYTIVGTRNYCFWYGSVWLRTFLNMLRIGGFIYPAQMEFFLDAKMLPPTYPVFLGARAIGSYRWHEDEKESWEKLPDGSLFRSWGFRGLSNMWLDMRNFEPVKQFMVDHKRIFGQLRNPWSDRSAKEVAPILDILSSATQIPDLGAKLLLIYCCLEHLFVPSQAGAENSKYIIGGLNALKPGLRPWFDDLYNQRNQYAHKGFVLRNEKTLALIRDSVKNVMTLLVAKLSIP